MFGPFNEQGYLAREPYLCSSIVGRETYRKALWGPPVVKAAHKYIFNFRHYTTVMNYLPIKPSDQVR